ncbi:MAG TPA: hypothetical protein VMD30_07735 [Tepidisphaeraceae bacterium]|nr:hypothetical protein [Tepidisphaeraceae bacterium]
MTPALTNVDAAELHRQLQQLDRQWAESQENSRLRNANGNIVLPNKMFTVAVGIFGSLFSLIWIVVAVSIRSALSILLVIPGILGFAGFIIQCRIRLHQIATFRRSFQEYQTARQSLLAQLGESG